MGKRRMNRERATPSPAPSRAHRKGSRPHSPAFEPARQRVVAIVGHRASGKTSLGDLLCKVARVTRDVGSVQERTSLLDWTAEERSVGHSLGIAAVWLPWQPQHDVRASDGWTIQLLDTPGTEVLPTERSIALGVADAALVVIDGRAGVEHGTEQALGEVEERDLPAIGVVSKLERVEDIAGIMAQVQATTARRTVLVQLPFVDDAGSLAGVIDLVRSVVLRFDGEAQCSAEPIPERCRRDVVRAREALAESVALTDDDLLEQYLEDLELSDAALEAGIIQGILARRLLPLQLASVPLRMGAQPLLDAMGRWLPSPLSRPRSVLDDDGAVVALHPGRDADGQGTEPFVASLVARGIDREGAPFTLVRVWAGAPPRNGALVHADDGRMARVHKWYRLRGPRRSVATDAGPGALLATWETLPGRPGDTLTDGPSLRVPPPSAPPPMTAWLLRPGAEGTDEALGHAVRELVETDRGLSLLTDETTGGLLLASGSEGHLTVAVRRLRARSGLDVRTSLPHVAYREVPIHAVAEVEGLHVREDSYGLVEEYGRCRIDLMPGATGGAIPVGSLEPLCFEDAVEPEEDLPERWRPAIGEGARSALAHGPTAGYPVVGARVTLRGGAYDMLQSTDDHFRLAGENGMRSALERAGTRLLEPWWSVEISLPQDHLGELINDISAHRGRVVGMEVDGDMARLMAHSPYRELRTFSPRLQTLTGGRGAFKAQPDHYEPLPEHLVGEAIKESPFRTTRGRDATPVPAGPRHPQREQ